MRNRFSRVLLLICLLISTQSFAATLTIDSSTGQLSGATGVDVNGSMYDVEFVVGVPIQIYDSSALAFTNQTEATYAAQALLDQVLLGVYDDFPNLTLGIDWSEYGLIYTAYEMRHDVDMMVAANYSDPSFSDPSVNVEGLDISDYERVYPFSRSVTYVRSELNYEVYADWSESEVLFTGGEEDTSPVPEPATMLLLGTGLIGIAGARRKLKKNSDF